jgi:hypothetical protein
MTPSLHGVEDQFENPPPHYFMAKNYAKHEEAESQHDMDDYET